MDDENFRSEGTGPLVWRPDMPKVLVIDDCPAFRKGSRATLQNEGFEVIEARDALAGLQRAVEDAPDLILLAQALPGLDGFEVCARIAREPSARDIPIIMTAEGEAPAARAHAVGARAVVSNSLRAAELAAAVYRELWLAMSGARAGDSFSTRAMPAPLA